MCGPASMTEEEKWNHNPQDEDNNHLMPSRHANTHKVEPFFHDLKDAV